MKRPILKIVLLGSMALTSLSAFAINVQIFTDNQHPVSVGQVNKNIDVSYYNLDELKTIINKMNAAISGQSPAEAERQAKLMMQQYKHQLTKATDGVKFVHQYGIKEVPTIVFDNGAYQIKGQADLQTAIQEYQSWEKHKN